MPRTCSIPGCTSNYKSTLRGDGRCVTTFSFPKDKGDRLRWLEAISRKNWKPTPFSVVCCKHFSESDIITESKCVTRDGLEFSLSLQRPKLKVGAVPRIFPNSSLSLTDSAQPHPEEQQEPISVPLQVKKICLICLKPAECMKSIFTRYNFGNELETDSPANSLSEALKELTDTNVSITTGVNNDEFKTQLK